MTIATSGAWVDGAAGALLVLFALWGALHGAVRQLLGLVVMGAAFALASPLGPRLEGSLAKVVTLSPEGTACAAWGTAFLGVLVAGGVVLHLVRGGVRRARLGPLDRPAGALVGLVKGVVVLALSTYLLLGSFAGASGPPLAEAVRESTAARWARTLEDRYHGLLRLPPLVQDRVDAVSATIGPHAPP